MEYLAVLREYCGEALHGSISVCDALHLSCYVLLDYSRLAHSHGRGVHLVSYDSCPLQLLNLLLLLGGALPYYGVDKLHGGTFLLLVGVYAQQVENLYHDVVTVGRQEVYLALEPQCVVAYCLQALHWCAVAYSHLCRHVVDAVGAVPDDVLNRDVVANEGLDVVVDVDDSHEPVPVLSEIIQERGVLPEGAVTIVRVVGW